MDKKTIGIVVVIVLIIAVVGYVAMGSASVDRNPDELVVAAGTHSGEPEMGFNPIYGWAMESEPLIQSTLFKVTRNFTYAPDLAENYEVSSDLRTYTVYLKDGIKFHDNSSFTAEDVVFTYNEAKESGQTVDLSNMVNVTAVNETTVEFNLNQSDSTFLCKLGCLGIVPSDTYNNETYGSEPIGTGPFKFVQWDKGQQVILEKNPDYYGEEVDFNRLTILFLENDAALAAAQRGEVDIAEVPVTFSNESVNNYTLISLPSIDVRGISLPTVPDEGETTADGAKIGNNVTSDLSIRQALNYGINRDEIIQGSFLNHGEKSFTGISNYVPWYDNVTIEDGDIEHAREILAEGGWVDTDGDGIVEKNGVKASFNLDYPSDDPMRQSLSVAVSEQAQEIGIEIIPEGKTWDEIYMEAYDRAVIWGFGTADPTYLYGEYYSSQIGEGGTNNPGCINSSTVDATIDSARATPYESSYSAWSQVGSEISPEGDIVPFLWIGQIDYVYFVDDSLDISEDTALYQPHGGNIFSNVWDWSRHN